MHIPNDEPAALGIASPALVVDFRTKISVDVGPHEYEVNEVPYWPEVIRT